MLKIGDKVQDFKLFDYSGNIHTLSEYLGKKIVIYFYPKDNTPGCTRQACDFRDNFHEIKRLNVVLFGISADGAKSHERFSNKFNLPFTLLSDEDNKVATYFGAYGDKKVFGKKTVGIIRSTYIIDEKGIIEQIWHPANASKNVLEVVNYLNK
ncbi:MAG: thioredoxin-dependent thiol peroxidase [Acholeplasmataceae bacterium]|jgi:peroxiredoxin Q/BCP|nr:thioredoxin-dependent thiol peroxidase [Acholeplasmataceae bacterium]